MFPKGFAIRAESPYHDVVKVKKVRKTDGKPKVKADTLKLKMRDILEQTFKDVDNPVSFLVFHHNDVILIDNQK